MCTIYVNLLVFLILYCIYFQDTLEEIVRPNWTTAQVNLVSTIQHAKRLEILSIVLVKLVIRVITAVSMWTTVWQQIARIMQHVWMASMNSSVHVRRDSTDLNVSMMWMNVVYHCPVKIMELVPIHLEGTFVNVVWVSQVSFMLMSEDARFDYLKFIGSLIRIHFLKLYGRCPVSCYSIFFSKM